MLSSPLLTNLRALCVIPPARAGAPSGETDLDRLACMVALYLPAAVPADSTSSPKAAGPGATDGINTQRPPDGAQSSPAAGAAQAPPAASVPALKQVINLTNSARKRYMMHDELFAHLSKDVFTALDANGHLSPDKRAKLQDACRKSAAGALFDPATAAPFGHQIHLGLADGADFDPVKRGLALAIAGCSAGAESSAAGTLVEATSRRAILLEFRTDWGRMEAFFNNGHELSGTRVNHLWEGVSFVLQTRAARATTWGCPEVEDSCKAQY